MKDFIKLFIITTLLTGCSSLPQQEPVDLNPNFLNESDKKVGILMMPIPDINVHLPGASCLLCLAAAEVANSSLSKQVETFTDEGLDQLPEYISENLTSKGMKVHVFEEQIDLNKLPKYKTDIPNYPRSDFRELKNKYNITHLIVINVQALGVHRSYSSYVPTSDPMGFFKGVSYMVNLQNNEYEWFKSIEIMKSVNDKWKEPPAYPAVTNAYYQSLELGKETIKKPFKI